MWKDYPQHAPHRNRQQQLSGRAVAVDHARAVQGHPDAALRVDRRAVWELVLRVNTNANRIKTGTHGLKPFRTAVSFWGQLGTTYSRFEWSAPKTGLESLEKCDEFFRETLL